MYNLTKRFKSKKSKYSEYSEYKLFYNAHNYLGYQDAPQMVLGVKIDPLELADNLFYTSFSDKNDIPNLWHSFAKRRTGVCLKFEVEPKDAELRKIQYSNYRKKKKHVPLTLISDISKFAEESGRFFVFKNLSTLGSYFIWRKYKKQREFRLLVNGYGSNSHVADPYRGEDDNGKYL